MFRDRRPTPPIPTPDDDATEVHSAWQSTLHRHLQAQQSTPPTPFSPPAPSYPQLALPAANTDGFRHGPAPIPPRPQRTSLPPRTTPNDETQILPRIPAAPPRLSQQHQVQPQTPIQIQYADPTDIGAQLHRTIQETPQQLRRTLEYYGNPQIRNILVVAGYQVHGSSTYGVEITENGPTLTRTIIPWHRVHVLHAAPGDPILRPSH